MVGPLGKVKAHTGILWPAFEEGTCIYFNIWRYGISVVHCLMLRPSAECQVKKCVFWAGEMPWATHTVAIALLPEGRRESGEILILIAIWLAPGGCRATNRMIWAWIVMQSVSWVEECPLVLQDSFLGLVIISFIHFLDMHMLSLGSNLSQAW